MTMIKVNQNRRRIAMKVDFKELSSSWGYKKLKAEVIKDCLKGQGCFNINGCNQKQSGCFHRYCDKFKWVIDRAKHYSYRTGLPIVEILDEWERDRNCWYMGYYQNGNIPKLHGKQVIVMDTMDDFNAIKGQGFRCPSCNGISKDPQTCDTGIIKYNGICDWKSYGLFRTLGKGAYLFIKERVIGIEIFYPIAFEGSEGTQKK
jgi:hypothetical protein